MPLRSAHRPRPSREAGFPAPPSPALYRHIAYTFVGITVIIVFAALWFSSVRATVIVKGTTEPVTLQASVDVARSPQSGQLPGRVVQGVFEKRQEFEVGKTGGRSEDAIAEGRVRVTNRYSNDQPLVERTRLLTTDGRLYRIDETVNVPSGGSVDVNAYADQPGRAFEFTAKTAFTVPGLSESLRKWITAESITPFTGGTRTINVLTQADLDAAKNILEQAVLDQAKKTLFAEVVDPRFSDVVYLTEVLEIKSDVLIGDEAERFIYSLKLNVTGVYYSKTDMDALLNNRLGAKVADGRRVVSFDPQNVVFRVSRADAKDESASVELDAEVMTTLDAQSPALAKDLILGLSIDEAEQKLEALDGIESATITVRPSWVRRLPTLKDHVTFRVE